MFAVGARIGASAAAVAVVNKARLDGWLAELAAAGIVPQAVYSETEGVPDVPATLMLLLEGERVYARRPGQQPFVLEGVPLRSGRQFGARRRSRRAQARDRVCRPRRARASARTRFASSRTSSRAPRRRSRSTVCSRTSPRRSRSGPGRICSRARTRRSRIGSSSRILGAPRPLCSAPPCCSGSCCRAPSTGACGARTTTSAPGSRRRASRSSARIGRARATPRFRSACTRAARARRRSSRRSRPSPRMRDPALRIDALTYRNQITNIQLHRERRRRARQVRARPRADAPLRAEDRVGEPKQQRHRRPAADRAEMKAWFHKPAAA